MSKSKMKANSGNSNATGRNQMPPAEDIGGSGDQHTHRNDQRWNAIKLVIIVFALPLLVIALSLVSRGCT